MSPTGFCTIGEAMAAIALTTARADCWPLVGDVGADLVSADDVYREALRHLRQDVSSIEPGEARNHFELLRANLRDNHKAPLCGVMPGERRRMHAA